MKAFFSIVAVSIVSSSLYAQGPVVKTPTAARGSQKGIYPWRKNITATIFWIGEKPTEKNPTPNHASSWDTKWQLNYGGFDDPKNRAAVGYRPAGFIPKLNPFYIALPYNDRHNHRYIKPEVPRVISWYHVKHVQKGQSCCKGRWVQIVWGKKYCFAQWEDCGPFYTDDWKYVFGGERPKNQKNNGAGIDLSPAVRDYLGLKSGAKVHWRFVDGNLIPHGPWHQYGTAAKAPVKKETEREKYLREMKELRALAAKQRAAKIAKLDALLEQSKRR